MKTGTRSKLDAYYRDGASWAEDGLARLRASRRIAWIVASCAAIVAVFEATALILLMPLKTVVPYTLMVDRTTGFVQALKPLDGQTLTPDAALVQSFLVQYVIARESFAADDLQSAYRKTSLWSTGEARAQYIAGMQASNPASPLARYPRSTLVDTQVKSVSMLDQRTALVRFETRRHDARGQSPSPDAWVAVIRYRFTSAALSTADRYLNPLGFQVYSYRRSAETLPSSDPVTGDHAGTAPIALAPATAPASISPIGANGRVYAPATGYALPAPAPSSAPVQRASPRSVISNGVEITP